MPRLVGPFASRSGIEHVMRAIGQNRLRYPLVTKPMSGSHGRGVVVGLESEAALRADLRQRWENHEHEQHVHEQHAQQPEHQPVEDQRQQMQWRRQQLLPLYVEEEVRGEHYRLLTLDGRVDDVIWRSVGAVVGNGISNVSGLLAEAEEERRAVGLGGAYRADEPGLDLGQVPCAGESVRVNRVNSLFAGGYCRHVPTDAWHPSLHDLAARVHRVLPVRHRVTGIDLITSDIKGDYRKYGVVNEVNAHPDLSGGFVCWGRSHCPFDNAHRLLDALGM